MQRQCARLATQATVPEHLAGHSAPLTFWFIHTTQKGQASGLISQCPCQASPHSDSTTVKCPLVPKGPPSRLGEETSQTGMTCMPPRTRPSPALNFVFLVLILFPMLLYLPYTGARQTDVLLFFSFLSVKEIILAIAVSSKQWGSKRQKTKSRNNQMLWIVLDFW